MASTSAPEGPSVVSIATATAILAAAAGYLIGTGSALGLFGSSNAVRDKKGRKVKASWPNSYDVKIHPDSSDEELMASLGRSKKEVKDSEDEDEDEDDSDEEDDEDEASEGLRLFEDSNEEFKLVLVVRTDLGMTKGKIAAQASHATLACYTTITKSAVSPSTHPVLKKWYTRGQAKIAVQARSEEELLVLQAQAMSLGLCAKIIHDQGRTQIASGTATVLGVGPGPKSVIDQVTGSLKLL